MGDGDIEEHAEAVDGMGVDGRMGIEMGVCRVGGWMDGTMWMDWIEMNGVRANQKSKE